MPTHGYGPFRRFILGSTTAKVLHDADCPVWTGVHLEERARRVRPRCARILCAVDLGPQSSKTLCWAAVAGPAVRRAADPAARDAREPPTPPATNSNALRSFVHAEAELSSKRAIRPPPICAAAARSQADLLVIGRGSAAGVFGRLRANAYSIIRQSPCPVVSV